MPATLEQAKRLRTVGMLFMFAGIGGDWLLHWPYGVIIPILLVALVCILLAVRIARREKLRPAVIPPDQRHKRFATLLLVGAIATVGTYFLGRHAHPEWSVALIYSSLFSFLSCASIFAWKVYYPRTPKT